MAMITFIHSHYWLGYGLFFSSLIVTIRTDFEKMLISRYMTWGMMPVACVLSIFKLLPITLLQSIIGAIAGFGMLWLTGTIFHAVRKTNGIGEGDLDLLAI